MNGAYPKRTKARHVAVPGLIRVLAFFASYFMASIPIVDWLDLMAVTLCKHKSPAGFPVRA
jgi:hypothetical protein